MTAGDKAKEIFVKIFDCIPDDVVEDNKTASTIAKNIAIKVVLEILDSNPTIKGDSDDLLTQIVQTKSYYTRVLIEIDKL